MRHVRRHAVRGERARADRRVGDRHAALHVLRQLHDVGGELRHLARRLRRVARRLRGRGRGVRRRRGRRGEARHHAADAAAELRGHDREVDDERSREHGVVLAHPVLFLQVVRERVDDLVHRARLAQRERRDGDRRAGDREARRHAARRDGQHRRGDDREHRADPAEDAADLGGLLGVLHLLDGFVDMLHPVFVLGVEPGLVEVDPILGHLGLPLLVVELQIHDELAEIGLDLLRVGGIVQNGHVRGAGRLFLDVPGRRRVGSARDREIRSGQDLQRLADDFLRLCRVAGQFLRLLEQRFVYLRLGRACIDFDCHVFFPPSPCLHVWR